LLKNSYFKIFFVVKEYTDKKIMKNKVPIKPIGLIVSFVIGILFAVAAFYKAIPGDLVTTLPIVILAFISILYGYFFSMGTNSEENSYR
jgi:4-hydroxybenzoate polyprenyltransferase